MAEYKFILDMDGVIYREDHLIPGAKRLIEIFQERGISFLFLTNNSGPSPEDLVVKLRHLGIGDLAPRHFYISAMNTAEFLSQTHPNCTAFVLGEGGLTTAFNDAGIPNDSIRPSYVVVGEGMPSMDKLNKAHALIEQGARLVATNPDNWCPVSSKATRPGAGATVAYLEASTGTKAYFLGKPNPYMFTRAARRLGSFASLADVVMIGDTMETDIRGAIEIGMQAYLVLSGSTQIRHLIDYVYQPTRILESVDSLVIELESGIPGDRMDSPVFHKIGLSKRIGKRHQTDNERPNRPRPAMTR